MHYKGRKVLIPDSSYCSISNSLGHGTENKTVGVNFRYYIYLPTVNERKYIFEIKQNHINRINYSAVINIIMNRPISELINIFLNS